MIARLIMASAIRTGRPLRLAQLVCRNHYAMAEVWRRRGAQIGERTTIHPQADLMDPELIEIGERCSISRVSFVTHSGGDRIMSERQGYEVESRAPIVVGDGVTIGAGVLIRYGVSIGEDAVIGMGCVVDRDVPAGVVLRAPRPMPAGLTSDYAHRAYLRTMRRAMRAEQQA